MKERARRAERLLRVSRGYSWGNKCITKSTEPVYREDGTVRAYRVLQDPWYVNRRGHYTPGPWRVSTVEELIWLGPPNPKARQRWLKDLEQHGRWEVNHALSNCCGYGNDEGHGGKPPVYSFVNESVPPRSPDEWRRVVRQRRRRRCQ